MSLEELEAVYRNRMARSGEPQVIVSMHLAESQVKLLKPRLEAADLSLSEYVRHLIGRKVVDLTEDRSDEHPMPRLA